MIKSYIQQLSKVFLFLACTSCSQTEDEPVINQGPALFSASVYGASSLMSDADMIKNATLFLVDAKESVFIGRRAGDVLNNGLAVQVNATLPADYTGKEITAYLISNAEDLSDQLDIELGMRFDVSRFQKLIATDILNGTDARYPMSAEFAFKAGESVLPDIKLCRSFAKVYIVPSPDLSEEQQRSIQVVSVEMTAPSAGAHLFQEVIVPERGKVQVIDIGQTLDLLNNKTLCYLYPDEEGGHLIVTLHNEMNGRIVTRRVLFRPRKNTAHKLTVVASPEGEADCTVSITGWDDDIQLPDTNIDGSSEVNIEEGIDLINAPEAYHYYCLLNDREKELYRAVFDLTNNFSETPPVGGRLEVQLPQQLQGKFDKETFNKVTSYLWNDMPVLFNSRQPIPYRMSSSQHVLTYRIGFTVDRVLYDMRVSLAINAARELLSTLKKGKTEFEIVKNVHDHFLRHVSYGGMTSPLAGNIVGGLVNKKVVCEGYSETFQYLLQRCGIQSMTVEGTVISSNRPTPHAWNIVRIDGKYYFVDSTWDDGKLPTEPDVFGYRYFLKSTATMNRTHTLKNPLPVPECNEDYPLNFD